MKQKSCCSQKKEAVGSKNTMGFHHSNLDSKILLFITFSLFLFVLFTLRCNSCAPSITSLIIWSCYKDLLFLSVAQEIKYSLHKLSLCHVNFISLALQFLKHLHFFRWKDALQTWLIRLFLCWAIFYGVEAPFLYSSYQRKNSYILKCRKGSLNVN